MKKFLSILFIFGVANALADQQFEKHVQPFLEKHCYSCHGEEKQKARIRYDQIKGFTNKDHHLWTLVYEQVSSNEMPPEKKARPSKEEIKNVLDWIKVKSGEASSKTSTGYIRRLNRRELSAYLQDITGLKVDYTLGLPQDGKVNGFDTGIEGLQDSPNSVVEILETTRLAIQGLRFLEPSKSKLYKLNLKDIKKPMDTMKKSFEKEGIRVKFKNDRDASIEGQGVLVSGSWNSDRFSTSKFYIPVEEKGLYRVKALLLKHESIYENMPTVNGYISTGGIKTEYIPVTASEEKPMEMEVVGRLEYSTLYNTRKNEIANAIKKKYPYSNQMLTVGLGAKIEMPYAVEGFSNDNKNGTPGNSLFRPKLGGGHSRVKSLSFSPDGKYILTAGQDRGFKLWLVEKQRELQEMRQHSKNVHSVCFSPDGKLIVSGSEDKSLKLWDVKTGKYFKTLKGHSGTVRSVQFSPDGKMIVSGSEDKSLKIWDVKSAKAIKTLKGHSGKVTSVCFSPDGKLIVSGSDDKTIKLWDVQSGKELKTFKGHSGSISNVAFSSNGKFLASASDDKTSKIWDVKSGKELRSLKGHSKKVWGVSFSPDAKTLVSVSDDKLIKIWNVQSGQEIKTLKERFNLWSVTFSPDGKSIVTGGNGKEIRFWDFKSGENTKTLKKLPFQQQPISHMVLQDIEIETNYTKQWPPKEWQASVGEVGDTSNYARSLISLWMKKAWRREINNNEIDHFLRFYESLRKKEMTFDNAVRATFHSVLMSGPARYLSAPQGLGIQDQYAIASKLSFMLTGRGPDQELLTLAVNKKLQNPKAVSKQIDRLLSTKQSSGFFKPFVFQWLHLDQPITLSSEYFGQQDFNFFRRLIESMRQETILYFAQMLKDNRPASEIIDSNWTMMNDSLARHYKYDEIKSPVHQKVTLRKDDPRGGGIIGQAGIQAMLTWMGENWIIYRGHWMLTHILDDPPPAPPLDVPELNPSKRGKKSVREMLKAHSNTESCNVCHKKIDPMGFAFRNFDPNGAWRDLEFEKYSVKELDGKKEWRGLGKSKPLDVSATLHRGGKFNNFKEFKSLIIKSYMDDIVMGLMKNYVLYGTGRKPVVKDIIELEKKMVDLKKKNYPMKDVLKAVLTSQIFLGENNE